VETIKIITWNIAGGHTTRSSKLFDYKEEELNYFINKIDAYNPDIVCFQENHSNDNRSVAEDIAKALNFTYTLTTPESPSHIDPNYSLGLAIISKLPFKANQIYKYPNPDFDVFWSDGRKAITHEKVLQKVRINNFNLANTQMLPLKTWELDYDKDPGSKLAQEIDKILTNLDSPLIFCGDFNFNSPEIIYPNLFKKIPLVNALPYEETRPLLSEEKRIYDHIYFSPELNNIESKIEKTDTDHYLCYTKLSTRLS
jgi:exonuclease III